MMNNGGEKNVSAAAKNDDNHRYTILVSGEAYIASQENTVVRPEPMLSLDHSSKKIELMDIDQDLEVDTELSLAPPGSFRRLSSPGSIHSPPPQLQQPPVPYNNNSDHFSDVLERIRMLERLSSVCSNHSCYGYIDEKVTENANNVERKESDDNELEYLTLRL